MELKIEILPIKALKPYEANTRSHKKIDVDNIAMSIQKYGMNDPVGIWGSENLIVEGHGRVLALKQLGIDTVPCIRLDHLSEEQRREYAIAHNATAELSEWDFEALEKELEDLDLSDFDFQFDGNSLDDLQPEEPEAEDEEEPYTTDINIPQYVPTGDCPELSEMLNTEKTDELIAEIEASNCPEDVKSFLIQAAYRHNKFNYRNVAEYYAHADAETQRLFERSALVIIDPEDAIKWGYVKFSKALDAIIDKYADDDEEAE